MSNLHWQSEVGNWGSDENCIWQNLTKSDQNCSGIWQLGGLQHHRHRQHLTSEIAPGESVSLFTNKNTQTQTAKHECTSTNTNTKIQWIWLYCSTTITTCMWHLKLQPAGSQSVRQNKQNRNTQINSTAAIASIWYLKLHLRITLWEYFAAWGESLPSRYTSVQLFNMCYKHKNSECNNKSCLQIEHKYILSESK